MLSDGQALLKAICADPDNDLPRLVYADYLEENGQPERAAFIRLQCEFARKCRAGEGPDGTIRGELADFWSAHERAWRAELPQLAGVTWDVVFHRGFVERVSVDTDTTLRDRAEDILGFTPIHHLCVQRFAGAAGVSRLPALQHLKSATITLAMTHAAVDELLTWTGFRPDLLLVLRAAPGDAEYRVPELNEHFRAQLLYPLTPPPAPPPPRTRGRRRRNSRPEA
jgi:uncharacterized protein (TIGR02996 family)